MFIFKEGSRHAFNQSRMEGKFHSNYRKVFKLNLPHMDTVHDVLRQLDESELEQLKKALLCVLFEKKTLHKWKLFGKYFIVAVDGTGVHSFKERHCDHCLTKACKSFGITEQCYQRLVRELGDTAIPLKMLIGKTFKKKEKWLLQLKASLGGKYVEQHQSTLLQHSTITEIKSYAHHVLEAKLIGGNGFSLSLGSEWIENSDDSFDKQDCEIKAFKRLAEKLKKDFPRLPICIVADGLYPNEPFFNVCKSNGWGFVCTFKEGNLPTLREEINELIVYHGDNHKQERRQQGEVVIIQELAWIDNLIYRDITVSWVQCVEHRYDLEGELLGKTCFEYLSSEPVMGNSVQEIVKAGRLRQKIENEGFNTQKNLGYNLKHKYARNSLRASKNYYQCISTLAI